MAQKDKNLEQYIKALQNAYGDDIIISLDNDYNVERIPSGSIGLDRALGGGIPRGKTIELFGNESSGKSSLSLHMAAEHQKFGKIAIIDAEYAFDSEYAKILGVDISLVLLSQPSTAEEAFETIEALADSGQIPLIILDSVAALCPRAEVEGDSGDAVIGLLPRLMGQHFRKVTSIAAKNKCTIIYINQLRANIKTQFQYGPREITPGGKAIKFFTSIRLDIRRIKTLKKDDKSVGIISRVKVAKNKTAIPMKEAEFIIDYGKGINKLDEIIELAIIDGIIKKSGSWYSYKDKQLGQGKEKVITLFKENSDMLTEIREQL